MCYQFMYDASSQSYNGIQFVFVWFKQFNLKVKPAVMLLILLKFSRAMTFNVT